MVSELDPSRYQCIRCRAQADVIFKNVLPYCFQHEPAESKAARTPEEKKTMSEEVQKVQEVVPTVQEWVVNAKDGTTLHEAFASKKDASKWASLEVEAKRLKAGQYKIVKKG